MGKNNVPSEFTTDFYSTLDNEDFDPFLGLDDAEVVDKLNEVEQTLEMGGQAEHAVDKGKKPIVDDEDEQQHSGSEYSDEDEEEHSKREDSEDEEDSDYIADEVNDIDDVEVDMKDFHANVDPSVEFMGSGNLKSNMINDDHVDVDIEPLDNDEFDSGLE